MRSTGVAVAASLLVLSGCYHYRVAAAVAPPADELEASTKWSFLWGAIQSKESNPDCKGNGVSEVTATTTGFDLLLGVVTLGIVLPNRLEWRCAKDRVREDDDFSRADVGEQHAE